MCLVLVLHAVILVCHGLAGLVLTQHQTCKTFVVMLVIIMILKDTTFQVLYIFYLLCAWNITTVKIKSGFTYLLVKYTWCLCLLTLVLVLVLRIWSKFGLVYITDNFN